MDAKELASKLDGCQIGSEVSKELRAEAKAAALVIVYGASDDLMEIDGAIVDECGAPGLAYIDRDGILPEFDSLNGQGKEFYRAYFRRELKASKIKSMRDSYSGYSWAYVTDIPHCIFIVKEGEENCCRGIVFSLADI